MKETIIATVFLAIGLIVGHSWARVQTVSVPTPIATPGQIANCINDNGTFEESNFLDEKLIATCDYPQKTVRFTPQ